MDKVLIIDDDRTSRLLLKHILEKMGYVVVQSGNGRHGWETLWENEDISFIITDMMMPDMDGRELIHLIRRDDQQKNMPVIIISGCFSADEISPLIETDPAKTFFIAKPLDKSQLEKHIAAIRAQSFEKTEGLNVN